jgi:hypothetical protein
MGRGCNSRRPHFLCHKYLYRKGLRLAWTRVGFPPPPVFWHAGAGAANDGRCTGTALCIDSFLVVWIARGGAKRQATSEVQPFCKTLSVTSRSSFVLPCRRRRAAAVDHGPEPGARAAPRACLRRPSRRNAGAIHHRIPPATYFKARNVRPSVRLADFVDQQLIPSA